MKRFARKFVASEPKSCSCPPLGCELEASSEQPLARSPARHALCLLPLCHLSSGAFWPKLSGKIIFSALILLKRQEIRDKRQDYFGTDQASEVRDGLDESGGLYRSST